MACDLKKRKRGMMLNKRVGHGEKMISRVMKRKELP
jgi:hypothetical protein